MKKIYSKREIAEISNTLEMNLPKDVINIINFIAHKVGAPSYRKTPNFKKQNRNVDKITGDDWAAIRNFKKTIINTNKEGILKNIDDIRCLLNKITDKSYESIKTDIFSKMEESKSRFTLDEFKKIGELIFSIGSKNKFCSHLYAKLYEQLSKKYDVFHKISDENYETYGKIFDEFKYVNEDEDYNLYCDYNKENENRKSMSLFFVNLMKYNVFENHQIMSLITKLINSIEENIMIEDKKEIIEETVANLFIFISNSKDELNLSNNNSVMNHIKKMTTVNKKDCKSLTTKTIFKYMDLLEEFED